jgi:hypothetical protein
MGGLVDSTPDKPRKQDLPKEIWQVATTLSEDAQNAAMRRARELNFDLNKGRIPLEETLINLTHNRDVLIDAVEKNKLVQLPLKLQYNLLAQTQKVSESLNGLINGSDMLLALEDSVDDLTSIVWQYNLHNLSDQVLGFHNKMNQLKSAETLIRRAHREAEDFEASNSRAQDFLAQIDATAKQTVELAKSVQSSVDQVAAVLAKVQEQEQKNAAVTIQIQQHDASSAQYAANTKTASADVEAIAGKVRGLQPEIEGARTQLIELIAKVDPLLLLMDKKITESLSEIQNKFDQMKAEGESQAIAQREKFGSSIQELINASQNKIDTLIVASQKQSSELDASVQKLTSETNTRLAQEESAHETRLITQLSEFGRKSESSIEELRANNQAKLAEITEKSEKAIASSNAEFERLAAELEELEGRIRESIERATGYTLFHSFQKRQENLARSKKFWGIALGAAVAISLAASIYFIYSLQFVKVYNAAFYLKLSISLPIIYAIAFCSMQYSRERRLEEEYAFKSSISISLDPYRKLVSQLVDPNKPEESAKYTAFVIESINRVFTSPTEKIFEDRPGEKNSAEKIIKAVGDVVEPFAKGPKQ